jgi:accessory gene regulator protein AgrB
MQLSIIVVDFEFTTNDNTQLGLCAIMNREIFFYAPTFITRHQVLTKTR